MADICQCPEQTGEENGFKHWIKYNTMLRVLYNMPDKMWKGMIYVSVHFHGENSRYLIPQLVIFAWGKSELNYVANHCFCNMC